MKIKQLLPKLLLALTWVLSVPSAFAYDVEIDGIYYNLNKEDKTAEVTYREHYYETYWGDITIPSIITDYKYNNYIVTSIGDEAFYRCSSLTSIDIPNSVTSIGDEAFRGCSSLTSIDIPNSVTSIGDGAFRGCSSLTSIDIPNSVTSIGDEAFYRCSSLTSIDIPNSVTSIGDGAFSECSSLQKMKLPFLGLGTANAVGNFGALFGKESTEGLRAVTQFFENGTNETYYLPSGLKELVLAEGCEIISYGGLYNCNMLESLTLPTSLYMMGEKALYGCAKLKDIYCKGATPAGAYDNSFEGMRISSCKVHVPYNTAELYKRSPGWKNFYYFEEEAPLYIAVTKSIENAGVIYGLNEYRPGQTAELKAVAHSGYTFRGWMENGSMLSSSDVYSFIVSDSRNLVALFAPVLNDNGVQATPMANSVSFHYTPVEGAESYRLDIFTDKEMTALVKSVTEAVPTAQRMRTADEGKTIEVDGLVPETDYYYSIKALAVQEIVLTQFTGSFTTAEANGIGTVAADTEPVEIGRYDMSGRKISPAANGVHIIRYSDGSVRKVIRK